MTTVSICSSVYNQSDLFNDMVASVVAQSYTDWELIVIDDASTEDIKKVCDSFNDPRIQYVRLEVNVGVMEGMNNAIAIASGKYIGFLSADERIEPNKILWQVGYLEAHPAIGGVWGLPQNGPLGQRPEWEQYALKAHNRSREAWIRTLLNLENIPIGGASWLTHKSVLDDIGGFDNTMGKCSDLELFVRFFKRYEGRVFPYRWAWEDEANKAVKPQPSPEEFQVSLANVRKKHPLEIQLPQGTVTIGIPVRDMADTIAATLDSIYAQTYTDFKIVVFDDASSDDLPTVLGKYEGIEFSRSNENVGCNAAQNHMLGACKTPFFMVLAADDTLEPTFLEKCFAQFKKNPWLEFVASQCDFITKDGAPFTEDHPFKAIAKAANKPREVWLQQMYYGNVYFGSGVYRTKAAQDVGGWDSSVGVIADYDMYLKLLQRENIHVVEENLTHTRIHDKNRSIGRDRKWLLDLKQAYHTCHLRYWAPRMKVVIATPFYEMKAYSPYVESLTQTLSILQRVGIEFEWLQLPGDSYVDRAKNTILNKVLEDPDCTDVFMIDSDMQWSPLSVYHILQLPEEIVMGSYPQKNMWETWTSVPVTGVDATGKTCPIGRDLGDGSALLQAQWISGGFIRIKRSALEKFRDKYPDLRYMDPGADPGAPDRKYVEFFTCERVQLNGEGPMLRWGEDRVFGKRMKTIGVEGWIYPNIDFGHYGVKGWMGNYQKHLLIPPPAPEATKQ